MDGDVIVLGVSGAASIVDRPAPVATVSGPLSLAAAVANACRLTPRPATGPFYLPLGRVRRDISEGTAGVPLMLRVRVVDAATRKAIRGAVLEIRHCDAAGGRPPRIVPIDVVDVPLAAARPSLAPAPRAGAADGPRLLRGVQMSDAEGDVQFRTVFPGWTTGRAVHIHAKVYVGGQVTHTGEFFVDERLAQRVAELGPYRANPAARTPNAADRLFPAGGLLLVVPRDRFELEAGLLATVTVAVDTGNTTVTEGFSPPEGMLG